MDKPVVLCPECGVASKKAISMPNIVTGICTVAEMKADLKENYGIESIRSGNCTMKEFYKGVKKDGSRVKEQMLCGQEKTEKKLSEKQKQKNKK